MNKALLLAVAAAFALAACGQDNASKKGASTSPSTSAPSGTSTTPSPTTSAPSPEPKKDEKK